jgi:hypothetical protein
LAYRRRVGVRHTGPSVDAAISDGNGPKRPISSGRAAQRPQICTRSCSDPIHQSASAASSVPAHR